MKINLVLRYLLFLTTLAVFSGNAFASHFRGATVSWTHISGNTVEITIREAWRVSPISWTLGDGTFYQATNSDIIATLVDLSGASYDVYERTFTHTYPTQGPYTIQLYSCCRIFGLENASSAFMLVKATVDLTDPSQTGSPQVSLPPIIQMDQGYNSLPLAVVDPDGPATCRMATYVDSAIPFIPTVSSGTLNVSSNCVLEWDASAAALNSRHAAQIIIEEGGIQIPMDFIIEIADLGFAPVCTLQGNPVNTISVGQPFSISVDAIDPDGGNLVVNHLGLPSGAVLTPSAGTSQLSPVSATFDWTPMAPSTESITIIFTDNTNQQCQSSFTIEVTNTPPEANAGGPYLVAANSLTILEGTGTDADGDPLTYSWSTAAGSFIDATVEDPEYVAPSTPGIYQLELTVTDPSGASDTASTTVVVYDPSGGFVTGGGWVDSQAGSDSHNPLLEGKANFGFVSKYKKGATVPTGDTEFNFHAGDLNFHSSTYEWLIVNQNGANAQYRGTGTVNGIGPYKFMIWASDDIVDTFRIRIWEEDGLGNEIDRYDNGFNQAIGGGSIVIHTK